MKCKQVVLIFTRDVCIQYMRTCRTECSIHVKLVIDFWEKGVGEDRGHSTDPLKLTKKTKCSKLRTYSSWLMLLIFAGVQCACRTGY